MAGIVPHTEYSGTVYLMKFAMMHDNVTPNMNMI